MTKRGRGLLEADVKQITDAFVMGEFKPADGKPLTAYRIATAIKERDGLDELPTVGGVVYVLERWERIGFATFTRAPFAFDDYTEEGRTLGLSALGQRDRDARKAQRRAVKAAETNADERAEKAETMPTIESEPAPEPEPEPKQPAEDPAGADDPADDDEAGPFDDHDGHTIVIPTERVEA